MLTNPEAAFGDALEAERVAVKLPSLGDRQRALAYSRWLGGEALLRIGRVKAAAILNASAERLARRASPTKLLGDILLTKGGIFSEQVKSAHALKAYQAAHRAFLSSDYPRGQAIALQNIANLYIDGGDFENADRYYSQSEAIDVGDPILLLTLYNNRATGLLLDARYKDAVAEFQRALKIAVDQRSEIFAVRILGNIAKAQLALDNYNAAAASIRRAFSIVRRPEARAQYRQIAAIAGQLALQRGDGRRARYWIDAAFKDVDTAQTNASFRDAHSTAYEVYRASGDTSLALAHLQALRRLTDEETRLAASTNTALMAARFDFANQELRIARLKAEELRASVALERSRARFQRALTLGVVGGAIIVVGLLSFGIVTLRRSRNQVRDANVELEASNAALGKALAAKTEFLATTSHEIRTPLNGILGMTQVILADRTMAGTQRDRIEVVHGAGLAMRALVDDILDVAKMETGHLTIAPEPVDLRALLSGVAQMWAEQARTKGLRFELDLAGAPGWIVTDGSRVRQIAFNLLGNALKFTHAGAIGLAARVTDDGKQFTLSVSDTGIGIPAHKHGEIFESFRQADSTTTRQFGGTGLGLTICRNLARALGGEIAVESREGQGSTFTVTLPLVAAEPPAEVVAPTAGGGLVILERNPIARAMLRTLLMPRAGEIVFADDVDDARTKLAGAARLLADVAALGEDDIARIEALRHLALAAAEHGKPAFVLWKEPDAESVRQVTEMAAMTLIEKPISGPVLTERLFGVQSTHPPLVTEAA
ncbi:hypothetical protein COC42_16690 [Sphingomonas spermidinifaciens]|uniref:histidine kinase n=1 Tax=Sphingomonas spermidinifaciens TaxID=1141889 RepID=A0A2A4B121_9SPHN|nr:ATP-binding protein [Sphingomonas spermidinifaciens]PCD01747.1 hypothetical protein COC42_16690 [Sphingomonas spermidinifaciens]